MALRRSCGPRFKLGDWQRVRRDDGHKGHTQVAVNNTLGRPIGKLNGKILLRDTGPRKG